MRGDELPDPIDVHVGAEIRDRRIMMEWSQSQLASAVDVTFQQVQKYERGINRVSASMLHRIAEALDCAVSDLFPAGGASPSPAPDRTTRRVVEAMANLSADHRKVVLAVAEALPSQDVLTEQG